jgi:hypothetical protein
MFCAPGLVFRRYRGRRVPFSCFVLPESFSTVPRASVPVFMFCVLGLVLGRTEGVGSRFHVLRARTLFRLYRGRRVPFSCFVLPDSFSAVWWASGPFFMFCSPGFIFDGTEGVPSRFHVGDRVFIDLFPRYAPCIPLLDMFSAVPRASGFIFMFCAHGLIFNSTECVESRFHLLLARTRFRRYRGRRVLFSCFVLPDSFSTVPRVSEPVFMYCAPGLIFGGTKCVGSRFYILRA